MLRLFVFAVFTTSASAAPRSANGARALTGWGAKGVNVSPLLSGSITPDGFVSCNYQSAGQSKYFIPGQQFSPGSRIYPDLITTGSAHSTEGSCPSDPARCVATADHPLSYEFHSCDGTVACDYQTLGQCGYSTPNGQFSWGGSNCPDSITPGTGSAPESSCFLQQARCVKTDKSGSRIVWDVYTCEGFRICIYENAGACGYSQPDGQFSWGQSTTCPDSITPGGQ
ncbi:hypothetical protein C8R43DRAFT_975949 [Mycena crocata]|nr:hypothetical protein C8R43DRAFT_975949 [Mycena crocata]